MDRKKELKQQYKQLKHDMGVFVIRSTVNNMCYLQESANLRAGINRAKFQLEHGSHPNRELQKEWKEFGASQFTIEVLEQLEYDKDETKTDYTDDLILLRMDWEEKLTQNQVRLYQK